MTAFDFLSLSYLITVLAAWSVFATILRTQYQEGRSITLYHLVVAFITGLSGPIFWFYAIWDRFKYDVDAIVVFKRRSDD